jgi:hypothetical protein
MFKVALFGVVIVIVAVFAAIFLVDRLTNSVETPNKTITSRFPEGWESVPVVEYKKPLPWPSTMSRMSTIEFIAAVTAVERLRPRPRPRQPANAVFNDAQIASMKNRLKLTREQEPYWQQMEASLREVVWDRSHSDRPRLEPSGLERFKEAAAPFVAMLSAKQQAEIQSLADIVGLRLSR